MGFAISYGAIRRYAFNSPEPYSSEFSTMCLLFGATFGIVSVQWLRRNIRVDLIPRYFPERMQIIVLDIIGPILGLFYVVIVTWQAWRAGLYSLNIGEVSMSIWSEPLWPMKLLVPIGWSLLGIVLIAQLARGIVTLRERTANK
jgi:TRAP-type mannitol/chloroaromatic compound transport system permease small subunit